MRLRNIWVASALLFATSGLSAQTKPVKVCVSEDAEGYDALRLAGELASQKLENGVSLALVAITTKPLRAEEEKKLTRPEIKFVRLLLTGKTAEARRAEFESLDCDYDVKVWYHESSDILDVPHRMPAPPATGDRTLIGYELRKAGSKKVLARAMAPPLTVYVRQGGRVFNPYPLLAGQIVKKLSSAQ